MDERAQECVKHVFVLLALHFYFSYVKKRSWKRYVVLVCFACALMNKPMAVTLPALMLVLDFWTLWCWIEDRRIGNKRVSIWRLVRENLPFFAMLGGDFRGDGDCAE